MPRYFRLCAFVSLAVASASPAQLAAQTNVEEEVRAAVDGLYAALNQKDADAAAAYVPDGGYTEFPPSGDLARVDIGYIREVLASDIALALSVSDLSIQVYGSAAVVTGTRQHAFTPAGGETNAGTSRLSMVWIREGGAWRLVHIHLSP
jgi:uncharacterized protein (TIGR02246 family)